MTRLNATNLLAQALIRRPSVTPLDCGCQELLSQRLAAMDFKCEQFDSREVSNLWAVRGQQRPLVVFAGHTDVVPTGPEQQWRYPPFEGHVHDGMLHGRGAADMKGSIASFVTACERFVKNHPRHNGAIGLLITSDEEGPAQWGTRHAVEQLNQAGVSIDMCLVGEPTSVDSLGDVVKIGRRGTLNGTLRVLGKQGHIAYPHLAENPLHAMLAPLAELTARQWDQGNQSFQPTSFQFSNIRGGTGATNVIPGQVEIDFNFRFSPESTDTGLKNHFESVLDKHGVEYEVSWQKAGQPYQTHPAELLTAVQSAIAGVTGRTAELSTSGGTSDGRFIAPTGAQVVEFGPRNATIHQIDECVSIADLETLSACYQRILEQLLVHG